MGDPAATPADIHHDEALARFVVTVADEVAYLAYARRGPAAVEFHHVYVPPAARGRGLAERITRRAFAWAAQQNLTIIPTCSYVRRFAETHPDQTPRIQA